MRGTVWIQICFSYISYVAAIEWFIGWQNSFNKTESEHHIVKFSKWMGQTHCVHCSITRNVLFKFPFGECSYFDEYENFKRQKAEFMSNVSRARLTVRYILVGTSTLDRLGQSIILTPKWFTQFSVGFQNELTYAGAAAVFSNIYWLSC